MIILEVIIVLIVIGFIMWIINTYIPMAGPIKSLLNALVLILVVIWLLQMFDLIRTIIHFPSLS